MTTAWDALMAWRRAEAQAAIAKAQYDALAAKQNAPKSNTLPPHLRLCLGVLYLLSRPDESFTYFAAIERETGLSPVAVKRAVRRLARMGLAVYGRGLWNDDGPAGAGYCITEAGRRFYEGMLQCSSEP